MLSIFLCACWMSVQKCLCRSSACFLIGLFVLLLSCMNCLYLLEIKPLSAASFADIFLPLCRLSFCSFKCFLCCAKACKFDQVLFVQFCFYFYCLGRLRKPCEDLCQGMFLPVLSSRSFMVSSLTFRSLNHFEFIFVNSKSVF